MTHPDIFEQYQPLHNINMLLLRHVPQQFFVFLPEDDFDRIHLYMGLGRAIHQ